MLNSRLGPFTAAGLPRRPLSLSYGVILPSSLTTLLSFVLGFSPHLPVSVCGTGTLYLVSSFSRQCEISSFTTLISLPLTPQPYDVRSFLHTSLGAWTRITNSVLPYPPVSLLPPIDIRWYRIINRLSIGYAIRLSLGPDLP